MKYIRQRRLASGRRCICWPATRVLCPRCPWLVREKGQPCSPCSMLDSLRIGRRSHDTGVCEQKNNPPEKDKMRRQALGAPHQGLEGSFCSWITGQRLAEKEWCFSTATNVPASALTPRHMARWTGRVLLRQEVRVNAESHYLLCIYIHIYIYIYIYVYIYVYRERERERERYVHIHLTCSWGGLSITQLKQQIHNGRKEVFPGSNTQRFSVTISSHNFHSPNLELRVSNPRTIAYCHFDMPVESSNLPGARPSFPDWTFEKPAVVQSHHELLLMDAWMSLVEASGKPSRESCLMMIMMIIRILMIKTICVIMTSMNTMNIRCVFIDIWFKAFENRPQFADRILGDSMTMSWLSYSITTTVTIII